MEKNENPCKPQFYYIKVGCNGVYITQTVFHDAMMQPGNTTVVDFIIEIDTQHLSKWIGWTIQSCEKQRFLFLCRNKLYWTKVMTDHQINCDTKKDVH